MAERGYEVRWTCSNKPYGNASYADCIKRRSFKRIYTYMSEDKRLMQSKIRCIIECCAEANRCL